MLLFLSFINKFCLSIMTNISSCIQISFYQWMRVIFEQNVSKAPTNIFYVLLRSNDYFTIIWRNGNSDFVHPCSIKSILKFALIYARNMSQLKNLIRGTFASVNIQLSISYFVACYFEYLQKWRNKQNNGSLWVDW